MLIIALTIASAVLAPSDPKQGPADPAIVVTAAKIQDQRKALAACLARHCPPNEDIDATLALAESQLIDGKYMDARRTLLASLRRNKSEAARYPIPVSDLYRANGRVAADLGFDDDYYRSTWGIYRTLKYGLPPADVRKFSALMEVAEASYRQDGHDVARLYYEKTAHEARKAGRPDIAAIAELRSAIRHLPPNSSWQVNEIKRIAGLQGPAMRAPVLEAKLALARTAYALGKEEEALALQQSLASLNIKRPILIYSPPYEMTARDTPRGKELETTVVGSSVVTVAAGERSVRKANSIEARGPMAFATGRETPLVADMWLDVAFRVKSDGTVADVKVTRSSGDTSWANPLLASIRGRRYTFADPNSPASRRLERYTYTSGFEKKSGSHAFGHSPDTRVEYMDLSDETGDLRGAN